MTRLTRILDIAIVLAVICPAIVFASMKADAQTAPFWIDEQSVRMENELQVRINQLCKKDLSCANEQNAARARLGDLEARLAIPQPKPHGYFWTYVPAPEPVVLKATKINAGLKEIRTRMMIEVRDGYVMDYINAEKLAIMVLWNYGIDLDDECWLIGEEYPQQSVYRCYDFNRQTLLPQERS